MSYKFAFTGGHHTSALVVAKSFAKQGHSIIWFGHKHAQFGNKNPSAEYLEVTQAGIPFVNLQAGKLTSYNSLQNFKRIPKGLIQAHKLLKKEKPDALVSFGSYLGAAVSLAAWIRRIPIFLHEQTVSCGKANLLSAPFARKIFLTWKDSAKHFPSKKLIYSGLPLRDSILQAKPKTLFSNEKPTLLIIGGKQGSHVINQTIFPIIKDLVKNYNLIHQTGTSTKTNDLKQAKTIKEKLPKKLKKSYQLHGYIKAEKIGSYLKNADLIISRSGAHTVYELAALEKLCILIPFEYTHKKEQLQNAHLLKKTSQATILREKSLTPQKLLKLIPQILSESTPFSSLEIPFNATEIITDKILEEIA